MITTMLVLCNFKDEEKTMEETSKPFSSLGSSPPKLERVLSVKFSFVYLEFLGSLLGSKFRFWIGLVGTARARHWAMELEELWVINLNKYQA